METAWRKSSNQLLLGIAGAGEWFQHALARVGTVAHRASIAAFQPRLSGANFPPPSPGRPLPPGSEVPELRERLLMAMALTGQTPVTMGAEDIGLAINHLLSEDAFHDAEIYIHGRGETAVAVLYAALTIDRITGVVLEGLPASHSGQAPILGILRILDIPQAVGLLAPRKVVLVDAGHGNWTWPRSVFARLEHEENFMVADGLADAFLQILEGSR